MLAGLYPGQAELIRQLTRDELNRRLGQFMPL